MFSPQTIYQTNPNTNLLKMRIIEGTGVQARLFVGFSFFGFCQWKHGQILPAGHQEHRVCGQVEEQRKAALLRRNACLDIGEFRVNCLYTLLRRNIPYFQHLKGNTDIRSELLTCISTNYLWLLLPCKQCMISISHAFMPWNWSKTISR